MIFVRNPEPSYLAKMLIVAFFLLMGMICPFVLGCQGVKIPPRSQARAGVALTAEAVRVFGETCARYVLAEDDLELGKKCVRAYDAARISLIATAAGIDSWNETQATRESIVCALVHALAELDQPVRELERHGVPETVYSDALVLVNSLGTCVEIKP